MRNFFVLATLAMGLLGGCTTNDSPSSSGEDGTMQVTMVDAPASGYDSVIVTVNAVAVHSTSSDSWITVSSGATTVNLLTLVNGAEAVMGNARLSAGTYTQMRLIIGDSCWVYASGVRFALNVPSNEIKVNINATVQANVVTKIVLDFDAYRSIVVTAGGLTLKPVIKVLSTSSTGSISGSVNTKTAVTVIGAGDTLSTSTGSSNAFTLKYVKPGTYSLLLASFDGTFYDSTLTGVTVTQGETTMLGSIVLRAK